MHTTYGMDTCIETNEILAFGMEVYSRYIPDICKNLEYVRHIPDICLTYDTIRIPGPGNRPLHIFLHINLHIGLRPKTTVCLNFA